MPSIHALIVDPMPATFETIIHAIEKHGVPDQSLLVPFLCAEKIEERVRYNQSLAMAYCTAGNITQGKIFMERAWLLSGFSEELLPLYEKIVVQQGDLAALREAYKRAGMKASRSGGVGAALPLFYKSMYTYAFNGKGDFYDYDFDVLQELERLAEPFRFNTSNSSWVKNKRKIRVAYLVFGATHPNSVIVKILKNFAMHHDRETFEIAFFVPENEMSADIDCAVFQKNILSLSYVDTPVYVTDGRNLAEQLFSTAKQIYDYQADILVTSALLADLKHYYIAALRPAPVIIGLTSGPPQQFSAPLLDWSISWDSHALIDCMSDCSQVSLQFDLPEKNINSALRNQYQIPEDAIVLIAAGRPSKFIDQSYWEAITQVLITRPNVVLVVIGLTVLPPFLTELLSVSLKEQVRIFGWIDNYIELMGTADVMIDTYPSGGGVTLMDAMALGIPTVTFKNNFMRLFDQTDWSPGQWIVDIPELLAERYELDGFAKILEKLIDDKDFRDKMGCLCREKALSQRSNPREMVKETEDVYEKVLTRKIFNSGCDINFQNTVNSKIDFEANKDVLEGKVNRFSYESYLFNKKEIQLGMDIYKYKYFYILIVTLFKIYKKIVFSKLMHKTLQIVKAKT